MAITMIVPFLLLNGLLQISAQSSTASPSNVSDVESRSLEEIYQAALAEGNGTMVVYSGGTARGQQAGTKQAFESRFPGLTVEIVVDYSIYQGPRIDVQLENNSLVPDVVQVQTLQDFPRWKEEGHLMQYKPANWSQVYEEFKDPDGYYTANIVLLLGTVVNSGQVARADFPTTAADFLRPEFANGQMVVVHPKADDFVLFYFKLLADRYGFEYLAQFAAQQPTFLCEAFPQLMAMGFGGANATGLVAPAGLGSIAMANDSVSQFAFPADNDPFVTYSMYAAIFQQAKRPETAKLYVNWLLERESPNNQGNIWSVRTDMTPRQGFRPIWEYTNSNHAAFAAFMADYEERERFSRQIDLFFGATTCDTSPLEPSLAPTSQ